MCQPCSVLTFLHLKIPMNKIEEKSNQGYKVDKDEADEDPLRDPDQVVHGASLKC